jgi:hypothetical protein
MTLRSTLPAAPVQLRDQPEVALWNQTTVRWIRLGLRTLQSIQTMFTRMMPRRGMIHVMMWLPEKGGIIMIIHSPEPDPSL